MPFLYQQNINSGLAIGIWKITESSDFFLSKGVEFRTIQHTQKQLQHLAGRYLLQLLHPNKRFQSIELTETGKPFFVDEPNCFFSISHSANYAAVAISNQKEVGVDIEMISEKALRLSKRFLSDDELEILNKLFTSPELAATAGWCIKETVFKWYGKGNVDFAKDIIVTAARNNDMEKLVECYLRKDIKLYLQVCIKVIDELVLAWTC